MKGDIYFVDFIVIFWVENFFGIFICFRVNFFNVFIVWGEILLLEGEFIDNGIDFVYFGFDEVGEIYVECYVFNKDNFNIDEILGVGLLVIDYDVDVIMYFDSNWNICGFLIDSSFY